MLQKLMKYEIKSCGRIFFPIYIVVLLFSVISSLFINFDNFENEFYNVLYVLMFSIGVILVISMTVVTIVLIIDRFRRNLLTDEGYLMLTLPVNRRTLIVSKYLSALFFLLLTTLVALLSFGIIAGILFFKLSLIEDIGFALNVFVKVLFGYIPGLVFSIFSILLSCSLLIFSIYFAIVVSHVRPFSKHKIISALGIYLLIDIIRTVIDTILTSLISVDYFSEIVLDSLYSSFSDLFNAIALGNTANFSAISKILFSIHSIDIASFIINLLMVVGMFFVINIIIDEKLDLE